MGPRPMAWLVGLRCLLDPSLSREGQLDSQEVLAAAERPPLRACPASYRAFLRPSCTVGETSSGSCCGPDYVDLWGKSDHLKGESVFPKQTDERAGIRRAENEGEVRKRGIAFQHRAERLRLRYSVFVRCSQSGIRSRLFRSGTAEATRNDNDLGNVTCGLSSRSTSSSPSSSTLYANC